MDYWIWSLILVAITYIVIKAREKTKYFDKYGIPHPAEVPFLGVIGANLFIQRQINYVIKDLYNLNKEAKYIGLHSFHKPAILVRDLDLIKNVLVKNFDHFADHLIFLEEKTDPLFAKNVAFVNGEKWRELRNLLSPAFTSSKMRTMHGLMSRCAENFVDQFVKLYSDQESVDMKDSLTRYANDVIATCAFGIEVDSLKDPKNEFYLNGKSSAGFAIKPYFLIKIILATVCPALVGKFGMSFMSKQESDFFINLIETTVTTREEKGIRRPDMLQLMMDAREKTTNLDIVDMTAQAFIFFLAGFDSVSNAMCFITHELAMNSEAQEKLQNEVDAVMKNCNGQPSYEAIRDMAYLDAVFHETMRMHPMGYISRMCSKEFELPPALPGSKPYLVKSGVEVMIPASGIHVDTEYYENPNRFDPERYLNKKVTSDVLNLGFGLGPRMCIANRFAILECKVLIVYLLAKCSLAQCKKTCHPMVYAKNSFVPIADGGFWLKIIPRS